MSQKSIFTVPNSPYSYKIKKYYNSTKCCFRQMFYRANIWNAMHITEILIVWSKIKKKVPPIQPEVSFKVLISSITQSYYDLDSDI